MKPNATKASSVMSQALQVETLSLNNGATMLFRQDEEAARLAISLYFRGGNSIEPIPGMADLVDRLLMKGTKNRSQEDISIAIDSLTLAVDTDTKRDFSQMVATVLEEDLEASLELMSELLNDSTLAEFDKEKEKMVGEIQMEMDAPKNRASDGFVRTLFEGTPYNVVSSVLMDSLPLMNSIKTAEAHYRSIFRPENMLISFAGNVDQARAVRLFEQYLPKSATTQKAPIPPNHITLKTFVEDVIVPFPKDDSAQAHIFKGWHAPALTDSDYYALNLMNTILGGAGLSARLFTELRDKQGLAYNVRSSYEAFRLGGMFYLYIGTEPSNKDRCLEGFKIECQKLMDTPVPAKELDEAKANILGRRSLYLETVHQQANYLGAQVMMGRTVSDVHEMPERISAVTAADIQRVAQRIMSQPAVIAVAGPSNIL
ncbi:MAG: insulinase family protein [Cyanobacteria bacterium]|nr:insulinase family protein [Cyanobacteriota bacterium]